MLRNIAIFIVAAVFFIILIVKVVQNIIGLPGFISDIETWRKSWLPNLSWDWVLLTVVIVNFAALFWIAFGPKVQNFVKKHTAQPIATEPADITLAKNEIASFSINYALPAVRAAHQAVHISAAILKDYDPDNPFLYFAQLGIMNGNINLGNWNPLASTENIQKYSIHYLEDLLSKNLISYGAATHLLIKAITALDKDKELLKRHGFLEQLNTWMALHKQMKIEYEKLQKVPQLEEIRKGTFLKYLSDPKFPESVFYEILE